MRRRPVPNPHLRWHPLLQRTARLLPQPAVAPIPSHTRDFGAIYLPPPANTTRFIDGTDGVHPSLEGMEHVKAENIVILTKPFLDVCKKILPVLDLQLPGMHKKGITCLARRVVSDTIAIFASTSSHGIVVIWEMAIEPTPSEDANVHTMGNAMDHGGEGLILDVCKRLKLNGRPIPTSG
ncbi:uncharacterized protein [Miscanthus floridulus]|uniref:uncharacterized protein isoform X2 n=1 Tax=Miscanthus floridulus TaxID=154761 RepID=UPI0034598731